MTAADIDRRLGNWGRAMKVHPIRLRCLSLEGRYRSPQRNMWEAPIPALGGAIDMLDADIARARQRHSEHLARQPTLSAAAAVLRDMPKGDLQDSLVATVERAAKPLHRYRCAACGFEAQRHFWQCPGCQSWDSYPPRRIEELDAQ